MKGGVGVGKLPSIFGLGGVAWWQVARRILELCCAGTQLAATVILEAQL